jgi:hypothetical protein
MSQLLAILCGDTDWSIAIDEAGMGRWETLPAERSTPVAQQSAALMTWLGDHHVQVGRPLLVLPSSACASATLRTADLLRGNRRQSMLFRLEEFMPFEAEVMAADFIEHPTSALGIAMDTRQWRPWVDALNEVGIHLSGIIPLSALILQSLSKPNALTDVDLLALSGESGVDLLQLHQGQCSHWYWCPRDTDILRTHLLRLAWPPGDHPLGLLTIPASSSGPALETGSIPGVTPRTLPETVSSWELAIAAARSIVLQGQTPLVDLRRGPLAPRRWQRWEPLQKPLVAAAAALIMLGVSLAGAAWWRAQAYQAWIGQLQDQQAAVFQDTFPGQTPPTAVLARFQSEARRLRGTAGADQSLPRRSNAVVGLHQVLSTLPANLRFRVLELRIDRDRVYLEGQARSHGDAETIAAALNRSPQLAIEPARTDNLTDQGVSFTLTGIHQPQEAKP